MVTVWTILFSAAIAIVVILDLEMLEGIIRPPSISESSYRVRVCLVVIFLLSLGCLAAAVALGSWLLLLLGGAVCLLRLLVTRCVKQGKDTTFDTALSPEGREPMTGRPPTASGTKRDAEAKHPAAGSGVKQEESKTAKSSSAGTAETNTCGPGLNYSRREQEEPEPPSKFRFSSGSVLGPASNYTPATPGRSKKIPAMPSMIPAGWIPTWQDEVPGGTVDPVHFCVTSPSSMAPGSPYIVKVWAYLGGQRQKVIKMVKEEDADMLFRITSEGPVKVARGTTLAVRLRIQDLKIEPARKPILWLGDIGNAGFLVFVPGNITRGSRSGTATILIKGIPVAKVLFTVEIRARAGSMLAIQEQEKRYNRAFASYASEDRPVVIDRIIGMKKAAPNLEVFVDVADLRSGEHWQERLEREILSRDVMYLFWSEAASRSKWVDWEWRFGLDRRGLDFIDPCPLAPPDKVPPPKELEKLHFHECLLPHRA